MSTSDPSEERPDFMDPRFGAPDPTNEWDTDEALEALTMERTTTSPDLDNQSLVRKMFEQASPMIAQSLIHIALHSSNDNSRLNAGKYINDFLNDREGDTGAAWEKLVGEAVSEAELHANASHPSQG